MKKPANKLILPGIIGIAVICVCVTVVVIVGFLLLRGRTSTNFILLKESGVVFYKTDKDYVQLNDSQIELTSGSYVKTGQGLAHVLLPDNSLMSLDINTELQVTVDQKGTSVQQLLGNSWHRVQKVVSNQSYSVHTPTLLAAVRGTIFDTESRTNSVQVYVEENTVQVSSVADNSQSKDVTVGQKATLNNSLLVVAATSDDTKHSLWYTRNKSLDDVWHSISSSDNRTDVIKKLTDTLSSNQIKEVPYAVNTFLAQSVINELTAQSFPINKGSTPPNIVGSYSIDNWTVKYDKMDIVPKGYVIGTCTYSFASQQQDGTIKVTYSCGGGDTGSADEAYISGSKECFSLYLNENGSYAGCSYNSPVIISGCLDEQGIKDLKFATVMLSKDASSICTQKMMPTGNLRIITIDDTHADKVTSGR